ncbi:hypothetical protein P154DRAFT_160288 [Amniculicola lignicola CBS 123094]|uniref:Uncharacterized protein n=1 Tax=Amniculicola lignicola CBS 123094 TaxID=1392246 RepID=A0A6A5WRQ2_9PLEO|nr:hypothetical protein P154DRAFT_160288 [Amniculicola lignicola CBS 123094]
MFPNSTLPLVHLSGKPAPAKDEAPLPSGECGYIHSEAESGSGSRQRCSCRSFYPDPDAIVRSQCGCGHQAWHHEAQSLATISMEEHLAVIEEVKRLKQRNELLEQELKQELFKDRVAREEHFKMYKGIEARLYENMQFLKVYMDDKVEAVVDKTQETNDQIKAVQERLTMVDEVTMELENRIDRVEHPSGRTSREATPGASTPKATPKAPPVPPLPLLMQSHHMLHHLPIRTDKKYPLSWSVRVIFVPRKSQRFAYDPDSAGYRRCTTRKLQQNLEFPSQDSSCFANKIETSFKGIIRGRAWMPMTAHRPADEPFGRMALSLLPQDLLVRDVWDYPFLEDHCIAHDKMQGDLLYISLQYEDVTWNEIRFLPSLLGADDTCWEHDEELDGSAKYKSLDSEIMYEYQDPPPYSSRTHSVADRAPTRLDVLADSASMLLRVERGDSSSMHSRIERVQSSSYNSERSSLRSFETEETDDEHQDKKLKLRPKQSMPNINGSGAVSNQPIYVSGRSKRKIAVRENKGPREPLHFNVQNVTKWRPNLLHASKGKETASESH